MEKQYLCILYVAEYYCYNYIYLDSKIYKLILFLISNTKYEYIVVKKIQKIYIFKI